MPERASHNQYPQDKAHDDQVKLLIALRRALGSDAKTPTHVQAVGVENVGQ
ncbi:MAG TPA: hypothetical protein VN798_12955 [Pseudomonas sp.]|jgi:hypothetical protein|uniref:hypothetical protein n=1 Tax=Pseudomonas sp. NPDC087358 TaxID=3364439 RepID=UPI002BDD7EB5|nr:hypothetical protein [Pseudomonas sp.]